MPPTKALWGQRIRAAREAAGLTQVQLGAAAGVDQRYISKWEHGIAAPNDDNRVRLARALGVSASELFAYPDDPDDENGRAA